MAYASSSSDKPKVGIFIGRVDDSYQRTFWKSVVNRAEERGAMTIGFFGHGLRSPVPGQATMNVVYGMANPTSLDALVVLSNTVGNFEDSARVAELVAATGLPAVSIEFELGSMPRIWASGRPAMIELVRHLAKAHGKKRIALVTGPRRHADSIEREAAFYEAMRLEGLSFDERLLFEGRFFKESGSDAVRSFIASGLEFDAVVCLNDYMALGALEALSERGLAVPGGIAVTGFDDVAEADFASPPLTTVRQPIAEIGRKAFDMALDLFEGGNPASVDLGCSCIYRRSCGCPPSLPIRIDSEDAGFGVLGDPECEQVGEIDILARNGDAIPLLELLDREFEEAAGLVGTAQRLRRLLYLARSRLSVRSATPLALDCIDQGLAFVANAELRREIERNFALVERHSLVRELGMQLLGTFSLESLARQWECCLGSLGIVRGHLVLFQGPVMPLGVFPPALSRLVTATSPPGGGTSQVIFPTVRLLPAGLPSAFGGAGMIIEPLAYQDQALGYLVIECGSEDPIVYESLRDQMSTAVKAALLMEELEEHKKSLELQVERRTAELSEANRDLKDQIDRRRVLEREVQEIGNRTMQAIGQDIHDDLCQHLAGISMLAAALEERMETGGATPIDAIREIRGLLESAVERSRMFARTLYPPGLAERGLVNALEDLASSLGKPGSGPSVSFQAEAGCGVDDPARALQLFRIVQEALSNAVRHSGSEVVLLRLFRREGRLVAEIRDFGVGLGLGLGQGLGRGDSVEAKAGSGMGLRIMRYRADSIAARLEIRDLDPGVCVSCELE